MSLDPLMNHRKFQFHRSTPSFEVILGISIRNVTKKINKKLSGGPYGILRTPLIVKKQRYLL